MNIDDFTALRSGSDSSYSCGICKKNTGPIYSDPKNGFSGKVEIWLKSGFFYHPYIFNLFFELLGHRAWANRTISFRRKIISFSQWTKYTVAYYYVIRNLPFPTNYCVLHNLKLLQKFRKKIGFAEYPTIPRFAVTITIACSFFLFRVI